MNAIQLTSNSFLETEPRRRVLINGMYLDESFLSDLVINHLRSHGKYSRPTISTAYEIYFAENPSSKRRKFRINATQCYARFVEMYGDIPLDELKHWHIAKYRDAQLSRGLHPNSVRKHNNYLNAMLNMAFKHLDIDRLSPFRGLKIKGEGEVSRPIPTITADLLREIKQFLLRDPTPAKLIGLIQLNTGMRISEPALAKLDDLVLEHDIPHLWVRRNKFTDRKTKASIRAVPLCGVSLDAARELRARALLLRSDWLVPQYANEVGNCSCSATLNKSMRPFGFRSHMFRHAFVDRIRAHNDIPVPLAESITGHGRNASEFQNYGSVGYTLEQKLEVIRRILI